MLQVHRDTRSASACSRRADMTKSVYQKIAAFVDILKMMCWRSEFVGVSMVHFDCRSEWSSRGCYMSSLGVTLVCRLLVIEWHERWTAADTRFEVVHADSIVQQVNDHIYHLRSMIPSSRFHDSHRLVINTPYNVNTNCMHTCLIITFSVRVPLIWSVWISSGSQAQDWLCCIFIVTFTTRRITQTVRWRQLRTIEDYPHSSMRTRILHQDQIKALYKPSGTIHSRCSILFRRDGCQQIRSSLAVSSSTITEGQSGSEMRQVPASMPSTRIRAIDGKTCDEAIWQSRSNWTWQEFCYSLQPERLWTILHDKLRTKNWKIPSSDYDPFWSIYSFPSLEWRSHTTIDWRELGIPSALPYISFRSAD